MMNLTSTTITQYSNGIYGIEQSYVRAFLIVGEKSALLLDTCAERFDIVSAIEGITDLPITVVLTHADGDHIGNLSAFREAYICERDMAAVKSHSDCTDVLLRPLEDGATFDIGGRKLQVVFTPGHTSGSVCLLDAAGKCLFAGDTVSYGPVYMFGSRRDMKEYLKTLERLREMNNNNAFDKVYPCHNSCPISAEATEALIYCVRGIINKTITGVETSKPLMNGDIPLLAEYGGCSVLFDRNR